MKFQLFQVTNISLNLKKTLQVVLVVLEDKKLGLRHQTCFKSTNDSS